ncbi:MAG TPA: thiamine pyrophosphate-binding protein [Dehalococcoidia bacterium]|nr:thiamine pyrophosphate-binding protein [Dehalococcoidia bacterium]
MDGSTVVARALKEQGAECVFTVVGGPVIEAVGACGDLGLRPIGVRHEQAAVMMAQAYAYVGGGLGVALLASGPAVTNAITGAHVAWDNCWPVLILGGSSSLRDRGRMAFQEADSVAMMRPVTKWQAQATAPERIPELIAMGIHKAYSGRPGPVYIDLPSDVLNATVDEERVPSPAKVEPPAHPAGDPDAVARAAELLRNAERPLLLLGKGVRWSNGTSGVGQAPKRYDSLTRLVERFGLPFVPSPMGRGFLPDDHPLCMAGARSAALRGADVVLVLGARLNWMFGMGRTLAPDATIIHVDVEPEEIGLQRQVAVPVVGDAGTVAAQLVEAAGETPERSESEWLLALREARTKNEGALKPLLDADTLPMNHHRLLREVRDALPRDAIISVDGQISLSVGRQVLQSYLPASRLNSGSNGCMGVGVPFAVGAKLAAPHRVVVSVNGDAAFGFNGMEMETALRHGAGVVFVVDNNNGIMGETLERRMFQSESHEHVATYLPGIRYDRIMEGFGGYAEHVSDPGEIRPAIERALASGHAACVDVAVDPAAGMPGSASARANAMMGY